MTEYRFPQEEWILIAKKRDWVPEWLYKGYSFLPSWFQPFQWIFNKKVKE